MEIFEERYYKSCTWFLKSIGLWPYQSELRRKFSTVIFFLINASVLVPVIIIYVQKWGIDFNITFENTGFVMFSIAICSKYIVTAQSSDRLKLLFEQIAKDWQQIIDKSEREILAKYSEEGRLLLTFYTVFAFFVWITYNSLTYVPFILDKLFPLNESRPISLPMYANYVFFEMADYHYWASMHLAAVFLANWFLFSGVDTTFVLSVKHACGLFSIVCHRLDSILKSEETDALQKLARNKTIISTLRRVVILHNESIRCSAFLENSFNWCFLVLNIMTVIALAMIGVYMLYIYNDIYKMLRIGSLTLGLLLHMLYINWVGQMLINESEKVFQAVYFSNWYLISTKFRIFVEIIMIRSIIPCRLTAGKITVLSMESFGVLVRTTVSYCAVLASVT